VDASTLEDRDFLMTPEARSRFADWSADAAPKRRTDATPRHPPSHFIGASSTHACPTPGPNPTLLPVVLLPRLEEALQVSSTAKVDPCWDPCSRCLNKEWVCHWPQRRNAQACIKCYQSKVRCSKSTNPPRGKNDKGKGKAAPLPTAAPVPSPPPFIFDAASIRHAKDFIASHSAALGETAQEMEKQKVRYDKAMDQLDTKLESLLMTIEEQAKST